MISWTGRRRRAGDLAGDGKSDVLTGEVDGNRNGRDLENEFHAERDACCHGQRDESSLQRLNAEQLRIVRRASRLCAQQQLPVAIKAERNPCVIASTDKAIADSDDPALEAFHAALPNSDRYDEYRSDTAWRAFLVGDPR